MSGSYALANHANGGTSSPLPAALEDADVQLIARTDAFVLFTGRIHLPTLAMKIYSLAAARERTFRIVDCGQAADVLETELFGVLEDDATPTGGVNSQGQPARTIFLHEVGRLNALAQTRLRDAIVLSSAAPHAARGRRRIIASSSEALLPRVLNGRFDDRLFYLLNVLHFDVRQA